MQQEVVSLHRQTPIQCKYSVNNVLNKLKLNNNADFTQFPASAKQKVEYHYSLVGIQVTAEPTLLVHHHVTSQPLDIRVSHTVPTFSCLNVVFSTPPNLFTEFCLSIKLDANPNGVHTFLLLPQH